MSFHYIFASDTWKASKLIISTVSSVRHSEHDGEMIKRTGREQCIGRQDQLTGIAIL
jgi:hypothetical protein